MVNRIETTKQYLNLKDIDFTNWDIVSDRDQLQNLNDYFQKKINLAIKEGYQKAQKDLVENIEKLLRLEINNYFKITTSIADNLYNKTKEVFGDSIIIVDTRANFFFGTHIIKLLLIIECDYAKEIEFVKLIQTFEKEALENNKYVCEILYVNKKETELNSTAIGVDFPSTRIRK